MWETLSEEGQELDQDGDINKIIIANRVSPIIRPFGG